MCNVDWISYFLNVKRTRTPGLKMATVKIQHKNCLQSTLRTKIINTLYAGLGRSVLGKLCPRSWVRPSACGQGPYLRPLAQFFPIRTSRPANNIYVLSRLHCDRMCHLQSEKTFMGKIPKKAMEVAKEVLKEYLETNMIQIFSFFEIGSFKLRCETVIRFVLCCHGNHQACCLLYYLGEINSGIYMYQLTFELLHFCFRMWLWFRI